MKVVKWNENDEMNEMMKVCRRMVETWDNFVMDIIIEFGTQNINK